MDRRKNRAEYHAVTDLLGGDQPTRPSSSFLPQTVTRDPDGTIREIKEQSGKDIWLWGSLKLMHCLLHTGVVRKSGCWSARRQEARQRNISRIGGT